MIQNLKPGYDRDDPDLLKIFEIISARGFVQFRISGYYKLDAPGLIEYKHSNLMKNIPDLKFTYLISDCFGSFRDATNAFYVGIPNAPVFGFFRLNAFISNPSDRCWVLVYRVGFVGDPVRRYPNDTEPKDQCRIFVNQDSAFVNVLECALPKWIVAVEKNA